MSADRDALEKQLFEGFIASLATALETLAGSPPLIEWELAANQPVTEGLVWRQPLPPLPGAAWAAISEADCFTAGRAMLQGAGIEDAPESECKSTYLEVLGQALSALSQALTGLLGREVTCADGGETSDAPRPAAWASVRLTLGETPVTLAVGLEQTLLEPLITAPHEVPEETSRSAAAVSGGSSSKAVAPLGAPARAPEPAPAAKGSKTFELLLDVELPVSVSFGHAQVPLKDVLKLTTGSIVELNRAIVEPVDVVVNNRVIARGEVVVVEGNFGVRIQQVVSRNERLRTLE